LPSDPPGAARAAPLVLAPLAALLLASWIPATVRDPGLTHGDYYSDANVLMAARNFERFGLLFRQGFPVQYTCLREGSRPVPYTHYPPGPEWLHMAWRAAGLRRLAELRLASLAIALLGAGILVAAFRALTGSTLIACASALFYVASNPLLGYADSLHQFPYLQLTLGVFLHAWLRMEATGSRGWLFLAGLALFLDGWLSFEHILFAAVFVTGRVVLEKRRDLLGPAFVILAVPVVAMALRFTHNTWAWGSTAAAIADLRGLDRITGVETSRWGLVARWCRRLGAGGAPPDDYDREFEYPVLRLAVALPAAALAWLALRSPSERQGPVGRGLRSAALLLAAALPWLAVFPTHGMVHRHLVLHFLPGFALGLGSLWSAGVRAGAAARGPGRFLGWGLSLSLLGGYSALLSGSVPFARLLPLREPAASLVAERKQEQAELIAAAEGLRVPGCVVVLGDHSPIAQTLAAPYETTALRSDLSPQETPLHLGAGDALWIEAWSDSEQAAAMEAVERYGLPELASARRMSLVFRGTPGPARAVATVLGSGGTLTRLRVAPTLDGRDVVFMSEFRELPAGSAPRPCLADGTGHLIATGAGPRGRPPRRGPTTLTWTSVPRSVLRDAVSVRLAVCSEAGEIEGRVNP
jgi:hypothetical protein